MEVISVQRSFPEAPQFFSKGIGRQTLLEFSALISNDKLKFLAPELEGHIVFVTDNSTSMAGEPWVQVRRAVEKLETRIVGTSSKVGVTKIVFNSFAKEVEKMPTDTEKATDFVKVFELIASVMEKHRDKNVSIIFFTDGEHYPGHEASFPIQSLKKLQDAISDNPARRVVVHSIGFSKEHDVNALMDLRSIGAEVGEYKFIDESDKLEQIESSLEAIAEASLEAIKPIIFAHLSFGEEDSFPMSLLYAGENETAQRLNVKCFLKKRPDTEMTEVSFAVIGKSANDFANMQCKLVSIRWPTDPIVLEMQLMAELEPASEEHVKFLCIRMALEQLLKKAEKQTDSTGMETLTEEKESLFELAKAYLHSSPLYTNSMNIESLMSLIRDLFMMRFESKTSTMVQQSATSTYKALAKQQGQSSRGMTKGFQFSQTATDGGLAPQSQTCTFGGGGTHDSIN